MNIADILQAQAARQPDAIAICDRQGGTERRHSYAGLAADAGRCAALLRAQGIGAGDRVLVFQAMSYELYVALLAIFKLGAVAMFIDPSAGRTHIDQCCELGSPGGLIASPKAHWLRLLCVGLRRIPRKFVAGRFAPGAVSLQRAADLSPLQAVEDCDADAPALLTFTSGSTGRPKAAARSHAFLLAQHRALEQALELRPGQIDLTTLPIFLLANLASGLTSVIPDADLRFPGRIEAAPVLAQIERQQVTRSAGSPAFYRRLIEHCEASGASLPSIERIDTGGAPVFPGLLGWLQRIAPNAEVVAVYGSTEAEPMAHIAWTEIGVDDLEAMRGGRGLLAGLPVEQVSLRILPDRFGEPIGPVSAAEFEADALEPGAIGEIVVAGEHVLPGYLHGADDTETKFDVDAMRWHRTGDAGFFDSAGRLWLVGRCSARIDDDKGRLYPFCVECAAQCIAGVHRSAMVAHAGRRVLLVEIEVGLDPDSLAAPLAWAGLDSIRAVDEIPLDKRHNAKIDYTRLPQLLDA